MRTRCHIFLMLLIAAPATLMAQVRMDTTFTGTTQVSLSTGASSVRVVQSPDSRFRVELNATYDRRNYEPRIRKTGETVRIEEEFNQRNNRGRANWTLHVPVGMHIRFESGAGSLVAERVAADLEARVGSGSYTLRNVTGDADLSTGSGSLTIADFEGEVEFEAGSGSVRGENLVGEADFSTGSGSIRINGFTGGLEATSGSGAIRVEGLDVTEGTELRTGSGNVRVALAAAPQDDLRMESGSGDVVLDYNGYGLAGRFTLQANRGRVVFPYPFDSIEETRSGRTIRVTGKATLGTADVDIRVHSGSGRAVVER